MLATPSKCFNYCSPNSCLTHYIVMFYIVMALVFHRPFQLDGSTKFRIPLSRRGVVYVSSQLDYETLRETGRTYYVLNISANVSTKYR